MAAGAALVVVCLGGIDITASNSFGSTSATYAQPVAAAASSQVLFGDQTVEPTQDSNGNGVAQAFPITNATVAAATSIAVYVDAGSTATTLAAGIYADSSGHPGSLLAQGSLASVTAGAWNAVSIPTTKVGAGTYWLGLLGTGGSLYFRDQIPGLCNTETSASTLSTLPSTWSTGRVWINSACPVSAYVSGTIAPSESTLPVISGTAVQGDTLTTSNGTWNGNPTSYAYQWQDCDGSGANCTDISGARSSTYALATGDVGHTILSVVTATNSGGSDSAASRSTAVVAAAPAGGSFGDQNVEPNQDSNGVGVAQAFSESNLNAGTAQSITVYVDGPSLATSIVVGLYNSSGAHPGTLIASGSLSAIQAGAWNSVPIPATAVGAGTYWIALLGEGGPLYFRDRVSGSCSTETSASWALASLPSTWSTGGVWTNSYCSPSAYVSLAALGSGWGSGSNCAGAAGSGVVSQSSLDACGLPSMNTTGPAAGTTFTDSSGFTANTPGQVYNGLNVNGEIAINASNVTIENSTITAVDPDGAAIKVASGVTGVKLLNDSIHGTDTGQSGALAYAVSYYGSSLDGVTMDHVEFYNGDRILSGYGTVTNSYCLGGASFTSGGSLEHDECIYTGGAAPGIRVIHDTLLVDNNQTAAIFVDNPSYGGGGVDGTLDVEGSLLAGGDYCIYGGAPHTGPVTIENNRFSTIFFSNCGQYGTHAYFTDSVSAWSGNVWDDSGKPVTQ